MKNRATCVLALLLFLVLVTAAILAPFESRSAASREKVAPPAASAPADPPSATPPGMVWIPGGEFRMGSELPADPSNINRIKLDEWPAHAVELDGFWMDAAEVTNRDFQEFVESTGYVTFAERDPTPEELARSGGDIRDFEGRDYKPGSLCFNPDFDRRALVLQQMNVENWEYNVWRYVDGASWRHPDGPRSNIADRMNHPVVHISWEDAIAYCRWAGKSLPTEAQWEFAARGGQPDSLYPWGSEREPAGAICFNYWQGQFPAERLDLDGFTTTAPVKSYAPNAYGLYDMSGNVWEWCQDLYDEGYYAVSPRRNPPGPSVSRDSKEPDIIKRVIRGGSFLCNENSCTGYRCAARMGAEFTSGSFHTGFRCVMNPAAQAAAANP